MHKSVEMRKFGSSLTSQYTSWQWIFYSQAIGNAVMVVAVTLFFRETRGSVLLSRKAHALNMWYEACEQAGHASMSMPSGSDDNDKVNERIRWKAKADEERESLRKILKTSLTRPFCKQSRFFVQPIHASPVAFNVLIRHIHLY